MRALYPAELFRTGFPALGKRIRTNDLPRSGIIHEGFEIDAASEHK